MYFNKNTLTSLPNAVLHSLHDRQGSVWVVSQKRKETNYTQYVAINTDTVKSLAFPMLTTVFIVIICARL